MASENEKSDKVADVVAIVRRAAQYYEGEAEKSEGLLRESFKLSAANYREIANRVEAAGKQERERDERLLFRLLWFDIEDYQSDWACNAYRQTIKDCCARLGIPYHESGKEIADGMEELKLGAEVAKEVYDE